MKHLHTFGALVLAISCCALAGAFEKKQPKDVDVSAMTNETQRTSYAGGVHLAWWIPPEYWEASLSRDGNVTDAARKQVLDTLRGYSMIAVVQAEVGALGNFTFYERDAVIKGLKLELSDGKDWASLVPLAEVPQKLAPLLKVLGPILSSAM